MPSAVNPFIFQLPATSLRIRPLYHRRRTPARARRIGRCGAIGRPLSSARTTRHDARRRAIPSSAMLQAIRSRATSLFVKILFGVLIVTFGIWGIGDIFRNRSV
ncbi:MAG TPA: SurA N-terminal domain-containing protein, partial [Stellaceae bacterium]|nr:SurA N-terminal domain-containing protein [Stellaceae bacterium]